jgi:hypothetical protein
VKVIVVEKSLADFRARAFEQHVIRCERLSGPAYRWRKRS